MAGRGRGRSVSFNVEALGFGRGESLPGPLLQPPPLFPSNDFKPVSLLQGDEHDYMLALKQEFRGTARKSPFYLQPTEKRKDISRYSDKYQVGQDSQNILNIDWRRFPEELKPKLKKRRKIDVSVKPNVAKKKNTNDDDIKKTLEILEEKEAKTDEGEKEEAEEKKNEEEEDRAEEEEEELYEEEDIEEETDYILSYFDNGEEYGDDDDDVDEGPVY